MELIKIETYHQYMVIVNAMSDEINPFSAKPSLKLHWMCFEKGDKQTSVSLHRSILWRFWETGIWVSKDQFSRFLQRFQK